MPLSAFSGPVPGVAARGNSAGSNRRLRDFFENYSRSFGGEVTVRVERNTLETFATKSGNTVSL